MKFIITGVCAGIIGVAAYATYFQKGVPTPEVTKKSVRNRSRGHVLYMGGHRYGK